MTIYESLKLEVFESWLSHDISDSDRDKLLSVITEKENTPREKWEVSPLNSVGKIKFGATREQVHAAVGNPKDSFRKTKSSKSKTENYSSFHVYYNDADTVEAVEIFTELDISIGGKDVFPLDKNSTLNVISGLKESSGSYINKSKAIGVEFSKNHAKSILFGKKGYYD